LADGGDTRAELIRFLGTIARSGQTLEGVADDQNLIDAGVLDSLAMVQVIVHLEQAHGVDLRMGSIDPAELSSVSGILKVIDAARK
jgi:acyl carrier protein